MADSVKETFNVPPGFSVEEINGQLYHEDLEEDDELWLIRMPCDVELSTLDRQKIFLSNDSEGVRSKNLETENGKSIECLAETREISNTCVVLPKKQDGKLQAVKNVLKGTILIAKGLSLNNQLDVKSEKEGSDLDINSGCVIQSTGKQAVKKKKKSFSDLSANSLEEISEIIIQGDAENSTSDSVIQPNSEQTVKKKKKSFSDLSTNNFEEINEIMHVDADNVASKKRKSSKKKRHLQTDFDSSDLNYETEAAENTYSPKSQKKKLSKHHVSDSSRKSSERKKVKSEPVSTDVDDEFPTCNSQK